MGNCILLIVGMLYCAVCNLAIGVLILIPIMILVPWWFSSNNSVSESDWWNCSAENKILSLIIHLNAFPITYNFRCVDSVTHVVFLLVFYADKRLYQMDWFWNWACNRRQITCPTSKHDFRTADPVLSLQNMLRDVKKHSQLYTSLALNPLIHQLDMYKNMEVETVMKKSVDNRKTETGER